MSTIFCLYPFLREAFFLIDPEVSHKMALHSLKGMYNCQFTRALVSNNTLYNNDIDIMGLQIKNPIGLAAGFDKNGSYIDALGNLGFGFIEAGTVTPRAQIGNAKPRLFRLPEAQGIINRLGFNNKGLKKFISNIKSSSIYRKKGGILGLNIGKNFDTPIEYAVNDYIVGLTNVYVHADYITINISSPNTPNLRTLQNKDKLDFLLSQIKKERQALEDKYQKKVPIAVKISPDLDYEQIDFLAQILPKYDIEGVIATNTTISRKYVEKLKNANQVGGLSGMPLHELSLSVIDRLREKLDKNMTIIGSGGITSSQHAKAMISAGAKAVQLYTGLIYRGPILISECIHELNQHYKLHKHQLM